MVLVVTVSSFLCVRRRCVCKTGVMSVQLCTFTLWYKACVSLSECKVVRFPVQVRPHTSVCMCGNCDDEPKMQTYCPYCGLPPERCTWLIGVCVYREQLFSSATWGGQGETGTSYSCGPGTCGNCGLNNVGEESRREEARGSEEIQREGIHLQAETAKWSCKEKMSRQEKSEYERNDKRKMRCPSVLKSSRAVKAMETSGQRGPQRVLATRSSLRDKDEKHVQLRALFQQADPDPSTTAT